MGELGTDGYIKLWRKSSSSRVFKNAELWRTWTWCLMKANHCDAWVSISTGKGETEVLLKPGQFLYGRRAAARELRVPESSIRNRMKKLENMQNLTIQEDTHYSIITIVNWDSYQGVDEKEDNQEDNQRTTKGQPKDTNKNDKNDKKEDIPSTPPASPAATSPPPPSLNSKKKYPEEITAFVDKYIKYMSETMGNMAPKATDLLKNKSEDSVDKLIRIDGFTLDYIRDVLLWARLDSFWRDKALSLASIRKVSNKNDLTKFQNVANAYEAGKNSGKRKEEPIIASPTKTSEQLDNEIEILMR